MGDSCATNADCSPLGDRFCDVSAPGGYCTVEGCDIRLVNGTTTDTCPSEAVCVRFFSPLANKTCDPTHPSGCSPSERCLCDEADCRPSDGGLFSGHCAPESSERRSCEKRCERNTDCRSGYSCRETGSHGAEPVPTSSMKVTTDAGVVNLPVGTPAKFCVQ